MIFDVKAKGHLIPPVLLDYAERLQREPISEVKENFALRFEAVRDYCNHVLELFQKEKSKILREKSASIRKPGAKSPFSIKKAA